MGASLAFSPINGGSLFGHLGKEEAVAYDPRAPRDEVADASARVMEKYHDPSLTSPNLIQALGDFITLQKAEASARRQLTKALSGDRPGAKEPKARTEPLVSGLGAGGPYIPKPGIPMAALRQLATRIEVAQAIHRTRRRQVQRFSQISLHDDSVGWRLIHADPNHGDLLPAESDYMRWLSRVLSCGGVEFDAMQRRRKGRHSFRTFLSLLVDDSLTFDHAVVETVPLMGKPGMDAFWMRDSSTFYLSTTFGEEDPDDVFMFQDAAGGMTGSTEFHYDEVALFQRNLNTDLERQGYGISELESSLETMTNMLQAMAFTREGLDNNAIPRGILVLSGQYDHTQLAAFQAAWQAKLRGVQNAFAMPVLTSRGQQGAVEYVQTGQPLGEMAFAKWIALQSSIMCSIYGMDPAEIGMESFSADKSSLSGNDTAERLAAARDKGLAPLLADIEDFISDNLLARFWPDARLKFCGLNPGDEEAKAKERARLSSIDELRATLGMEPHPVKWIGSLPADPTMQEAEFKRQSLVGVVKEGRKLWGFEPHPDPVMEMAPLNPSLASSYQQALTGRAGLNGDGPAAGDPFGGGDGNPWGQDEGQGADAEGAGGGADGDGAEDPGLSEGLASEMGDKLGGFEPGQGKGDE